jgi:hypothetical protein
LPGCEIGGLARLGFGIPAFKFQEHGPEQQVIRDASNEGSFGNPADECWRAAPLRWQVPLLTSLKTVPCPLQYEKGPVPHGEALLQTALLQPPWTSPVRPAALTRP